MDKPSAFDEEVNVGEDGKAQGSAEDGSGVKVLIDSKALFSIIGSEMDWVEDKLQARFVFRNPNISESSPKLDDDGGDADNSIQPSNAAAESPSAYPDTCSNLV